MAGPGEPVPPARGPSSGWVVLGGLGAPHGLDGSWRFVPETHFPERLRPGRRVALLGPDGTVRWTALREVRQHGRHLMVAVEGIGTREQAEPFTGGHLAVDRADLPPLPAGSYYHHQLVGLTVVRADDSVLGVVVRVLETGANDVLDVRRVDGRQALIPMIRAAVARIEPANGLIQITDLPGLVDD